MRIVLALLAMIALMGAARPARLRRPDFQAKFVWKVRGEDRAGMLAVSGMRVRIDDGESIFIATIDPKRCDLATDSLRLFDLRSHWVTRGQPLLWATTGQLASWLDADCVQQPFEKLGRTLVSGRHAEVLRNGRARWWRDPALHAVIHFEGDGSWIMLSDVHVGKLPARIWKPRGFTAAPVQAAVPTRREELGAGHDAAAEKRCLAHGGAYRPVGMRRQYFCVERMKDAGKPCTDGSQCEGHVCVATDRSAVPPGAILGKCIEDNLGGLGGCIPRVENGTVTSPLCLD